MIYKYYGLSVVFKVVLYLSDYESNMCSLEKKSENPEEYQTESDTQLAIQHFLSTYYLPGSHVN